MLFYSTQYSMHIKQELMHHHHVEISCIAPSGRHGRLAIYIYMSVEGIVFRDSTSFFIRD